MSELNKEELSKVNGGIVLHNWFIKYQIGATKYVVESLQGEYKEGYDQAIQSCR